MVIDLCFKTVYSKNLNTSLNNIIDQVYKLKRYLQVKKI